MSNEKMSLDLFISIRGRVLINVEALNMTESVGNYTKHRRVPVIVADKGYITYFVPAISGEAIAHGFQTVLAEVAKREGLPVCKLCEKGIFLKSTGLNIIEDSIENIIKLLFIELKNYLGGYLNVKSTEILKINKLKEEIEDLLEELSSSEKENIKRQLNNLEQLNVGEIIDMLENIILEKIKLKKIEPVIDILKNIFKIDPELEKIIEKLIVSNCMVEDVGGFMLAERNVPVKRTSNFFVGYMIPVKEAIENAIIEPQLHMRYALGTPFVRSSTGQEQTQSQQEQSQTQAGQMIYYVELASAVYTFSFDLDTSYIGKGTYYIENIGKLLVNGSNEQEKEENRKKRIIATLNALREFLLEFRFGAKKTRFLPIIEPESFVIAVSNKIWTVPSPFVKSYIKDAIIKLKETENRQTIKENKQNKEIVKLYIYSKDQEFKNDPNIQSLIQNSELSKKIKIFDNFESMINTVIDDIINNKIIEKTETSK